MNIFMRIQLFLSLKQLKIPSRGKIKKILLCSKSFLESLVTFKMLNVQSFYLNFMNIYIHWLTLAALFILQSTILSEMLSQAYRKSGGRPGGKGVPSMLSLHHHFICTLLKTKREEWGDAQDTGFWKKETKWEQDKKSQKAGNVWLASECVLHETKQTNQWGCQHVLYMQHILSVSTGLALVTTSND